MSKSSNAQAYKGAGKGISESGQALGRCGLPTLAQIDMAACRLVHENPSWSTARCAQRARVVVYTGGVS